MSICFTQHLTAGLTMRNIAAWLSEHGGISTLMGNPISPLKDLSYAACHPVLASSIYSASPTDNATIFVTEMPKILHHWPSGKHVLMWSDNHLYFHPNLSLSIQLTWYLNFHCT